VYYYFIPAILFFGITMNEGKGMRLPITGPVLNTGGLKMAGPI
jgi:hypothetical protein